MQQTSTSKTELRKLEATLHQARQTSELRGVVELLELLRADAISKLIGKDGNREVEVGMVRAYERVIRAVTSGPVTAEQFVKTGE